MTDTKTADIGPMLLRGYVPLTDHGFALPCYALAPQSNTWHTAVCSIDGDHVGKIVGFEHFGTDDVNIIPEGLQKVVEVGGAWQDVFLWSGEVYVGTPPEIFVSLRTEIDRVSRAAPLSFLDLATFVEEIDSAKALDAAFQLVNSRLGTTQAKKWLLDTFVTEKIILQIRRLLFPTRVSSEDVRNSFSIRAMDGFSFELKLSRRLLTTLEERGRFDAALKAISRLPINISFATEENYLNYDPFYTKSASQKLAEIERTFGIVIDPATIKDHERLASLRFELQSRIGKSNPRFTTALSKLFFSYVKYGPRLLQDRPLIAATIEDLTAEFGEISGIDADNARELDQGESLETLDAATVNELMGRYHFLGYGRDSGLHLGLRSRSRDGTGPPLAVASLSAWDIDHADPALHQLELDRSEVLVLARLLSLSGGRITLSHFIAHLVRWVRSELPHIKIITTYCNPNAGQYGTVFRGANFHPLCTEEHPFIPFHHGKCISSRELIALCDVEGVEHCKRVIRPGAVKPIPLLLYYYPVRLSKKARQRFQVMTCRHPYPFDLAAVGERRFDESGQYPSAI